jgi:hypothetical protein
MLKSQGMSNRAIAHRLGVSEMAIRKLVGPSKPAESAQLALPAIPTTTEKPTTTGVPVATLSGEGRDRATRSAEESIGDGDPVAAPEAANDDEPVPMSLDGDAEDRTLDRQLAYLGLLDDAAPLFREGSSVPGVGVLLDLPCLIESGLFRICRKLYGEIGPAFYGLRTTLLTLLLMALLRMKRPEHLKEKDPAARFERRLRSVDLINGARIRYRERVSARLAFASEVSMIERDADCSSSVCSFSTLAFAAVNALLISSIRVSASIWRRGPSGSAAMARCRAAKDAASPSAPLPTNSKTAVAGTTSSTSGK